MRPLVTSPQQQQSSSDFAVKPQVLPNLITEESSDQKLTFKNIKSQRHHKRNKIREANQLNQENNTFQSKLKKLQVSDLKSQDEKALNTVANKNFEFPSFDCHSPSKRREIQSPTKRMQSPTKRRELQSPTKRGDFGNIKQPLETVGQQSRIQTSQPNNMRLSRQVSSVDSPGSKQDLQSPKVNTPVKPKFDPLAPMPILSKNFARNQEPELWRIKKVNYKKQFAQTLPSQDSALNPSRLLEPIDMQQNQDEPEQQTAEQVQLDQKLKQIRDKLSSHADQITVTQKMPIKLDKYPTLFKFKIYECFKPKNLQSARQYIQYLIHGKEVIQNPEVEQYESEHTKTMIPPKINSKNILQFHSNFEQGNLDSAYLINEKAYNLLLKVDTNTKGNTHWFYFKIQNWQPGQEYIFNILNMSRDLSKFYHRGMNIMTQMETGDGHKTEWTHTGRCNITEVERQNDIAKQYEAQEGHKAVKNGFYGSLKFTCKMPQESELMFGGELRQSRGIAMSFAYAIPYTYTDFLIDVQEVKSCLIQAGGKVQRSAPKFDLPKISRKPKPVERKSSKQMELQKMRALQQIKEIKTKADQYIVLTKDEQKAIKSNNPVVAEERSRLLTQIQSTCTEVIQLGPFQFKQEVISSSVGGLNIYQFTISNYSRKPNAQKKIMYLQARVHPGETHSSFVMKNIMEQLVVHRDKYDKILQYYVIKLTPMLCVDGVTIGNARCALVGVDLNRRWANPHSVMHPEIYFIKMSMLEQAERISIFVDIHGHNKKENCFFYGCNKAANEGMLSWTKTRLLPKIFSANEPIFDYQLCRFHQDNFKLNTARVVVWCEMNCFNSFTLEVSQYGRNTNVQAGVPQPMIVSNDGKKEYVHIERGNTSKQFELAELKTIAIGLLNSCMQYAQLEPQLEKDTWLKPSQLATYGGESARKKLQRDIRSQKAASLQRAGVGTAPQQRYVNSNTAPRPQHNCQKSHGMSPDDSVMQSKNQGPRSQFTATATPVVLSQDQMTSLPQPKLRNNLKSQENNDIQGLLPTVDRGKGNWRQYFGNEELERAQIQINTSRMKKNHPLMPNSEDDDDDDDDQSDSGPSDDNFDQQFHDNLQTQLSEIDETCDSKSKDNAPSRISRTDTLKISDVHQISDKELQILNEVNESQHSSISRLDQLSKKGSQDRDQADSTDTKLDTGQVPKKKNQPKSLLLITSLSPPQQPLNQRVKRVPSTDETLTLLNQNNPSPTSSKYSFTVPEPPHSQQPKPRHQHQVIKLNSMGLPPNFDSFSQQSGDDWYQRNFTHTTYMHKSHNLQAQLDEQRNFLMSKSKQKADMSNLKVLGQVTSLQSPKVQTRMKKSFAEHLQDINSCSDAHQHHASVQASRETLSPYNQSGFGYPSGSQCLQIKQPAMVYCYRKGHVVHSPKHNQCMCAQQTPKERSTPDSLSKEGYSAIKTITFDSISQAPQTAGSVKSKIRPSQLVETNTCTRVPAQAQFVKRYYESPISNQQPQMPKFSARGTQINNVSPTFNQNTKKVTEQPQTNNAMITKLKINQTLLQDALRHQQTPTTLPQPGKPIFSFKHGGVSSRVLNHKFTTDLNVSTTKKQMEVQRKSTQKFQCE